MFGKYLLTSAKALIISARRRGLPDCLARLSDSVTRLPAAIAAFDHAGEDSTRELCRAIVNLDIALEQVKFLLDEDQRLYALRQVANRKMEKENDDVVSHE